MLRKAKGAYILGVKYCSARKAEWKIEDQHRFCPPESGTESVTLTITVTEDVLLQLAVKFEQRWFLTHLARRPVIHSPRRRCCWKRIPFGMPPGPELSRQEKLDRILESITDIHRNFDDLLITLSALMQEHDRNKPFRKVLVKEH